MTYSLGVDLGTTFVVAAVARPTGVALVPLGEQSVVAPAVVAVRPDGSVVTGDAAERRAVSQPAAVARGVVRRLGDPEPVRLGDLTYPASTLLSAQLRDVAQRVAEREGEPAERVVLTCPATWSAARRARLVEAAEAAGLAGPQLVTDAEAAVRHAAPGRVRDGGVVAVYDLGGGGFQATVVRVGPQGPEILGTPECVEGVGGTNVDEAILSYVDDAVGGALARLDVDDARTAVALARLRQDCGLAKETLSLDSETVVPVLLPGRHLDIRLSRVVFEQMLRSPLEATVGALGRAVDSAGLAPADVDAVLLVGGSTRIPLVARTVAAAFGRPLLEGVHPVHAVALGAAALAAVPVPALPTGWDAEPAEAPTAVVDTPWSGTNGTADGVTAAVPVPADEQTQVVELPRSGAGPAEAPTEFLQLPRFTPETPPAWPAPVPPGPPAGVEQPWTPPAPPPAPAPRRRVDGGVLIMIIGTVVALLVLVLVFALAP